MTTETVLVHNPKRPGASRIIDKAKYDASPDDYQLFESEAKEPVNDAELDELRAQYLSLTEKEADARWGVKRLNKELADLTAPE